MAALKLFPRRWLTNVMVAFGTVAPCASRTEPDTVPLVVCAPTRTWATNSNSEDAANATSCEVDQ
jgi:hypothetical protein